ncbi:MAG: PadR family transcriptional regulator [Thermofilum sp.]|uniref:PadR family transcriptional regulator n=1 Tax=Thermofilum pendens TaxID=2269 RepID=A0A7C4D4L8_THEPE
MSTEQLDRLKSIRVNTVVKLYTLVLLAEEERHGYELMKLLAEMLGAPIGPSQVYPFLNKLEKAGLLGSRISGSREKKVYYLTPQGYEFVKELLEKSLSVLHTAVKILGKEKVCLP